MARPRQFDEQMVLDAAIELFWSRGFEGTSIEHISTSTGVGNGSIYAAYGNKLGLFLAVFELYCDRRAAFIEEVVETAEGSAHDAVGNFFEAVIADCASQPGRRGCLMINSIAELGQRVPEVVSISARSTGRMEMSLANRLRQAGGESLDDRDVSALSAHLVLVSQGLIQLSRLGVAPDRLREIAEVSRKTLASYAAA